MPKLSEFTHATKLAALAASEQLWHTPDGDAYATVEINGHHENLCIRTRAFKRWLARQYYVFFVQAPSSQSVNDALNVIEGRAIHEGEQQQVHVRLAEHKGSIYLDLCNPDWQAVEITPAGWRVIDNPPIKFRRAKAMLPLPMPSRNGSVERLRDYVNVSEEDWPLVAAWLLAALRPQGPFPVLCLHGEQGSAKSTVARVLRSLVDPNTAAVRCEPREPRDLMIAANNGWVIALDNLSHIQPWLSDALCRLSTGGGFSTRELYSDAEECIFDAMRPITVNGITELGTRGDLLDRSVLVSLPLIPDSQRREEKEFWASFGRAQPAIFGGVLTAVSTALQNMPTTKLAALPRMADFARWSVAGEAAMGMQPGMYLRTYMGNRAGANELAIECSPVGKAVIDMMASTSAWEGTATELLAELDQRADEKTRKLRTWPETPQGLSATLKRLAPNLRAIGIEVDSSRSKKRRCLTITRQGTQGGVTTVTAVTPRQNVGDFGPSGHHEVTTGDDGVTAFERRNDAGDDDDDDFPTVSAPHMVLTRPWGLVG